jgi:predicted nucleotidyltransferase
MAFSRGPLMRSSAVQSRPALGGSALRNAVRESVRKHLDLDCYQLFIFGSEASGVADRRSDIDIGILGPQPVPGAVMQAVRQDLETLRTLRSFDVVDLSVADAGFRVEALAHAERL